jgi:hypothetical protein
MKSSVNFLVQFGGEMSELDDASTYFDLGPRKVTANGIYHYMCSRNNNFSNRSQKGKIVVSNTAVASKKIGWNGGNVTIGERLVFGKILLEGSYLCAKNHLQPSRSNNDVLL